MKAGCEIEWQPAFFLVQTAIKTGAACAGNTWASDLKRVKIR
jgi:hypothetical protein